MESAVAIGSVKTVSTANILDSNLKIQETKERKHSVEAIQGEAKL